MKIFFLFVVFEFLITLIKGQVKKGNQNEKELFIQESDSRSNYLADHFRFLEPIKSQCQGSSATNPKLYYAHYEEKEEIPLRTYLNPLDNDIVIRIQALPTLGLLEILGDEIKGNSPTTLTQLFYTAPSAYTTALMEYDVTIGSNTKSDSCFISIRTCYTSCFSCDDETTLSPPTSKTNHNCNSCRTNYYPLENTRNCYSNASDKIYFDPTNPGDPIYKECPIECLRCSMKPPTNDVICDSCDNDNQYYGKVGDLTGGCYNQAQCPDWVLDTSTTPPLWKPDSKCQKFCLDCNTEGTDADNKCKACINPYYFYDDSPTKNPTNCYLAEDGYYLDLGDNKFRKCHSTCLSCTNKQILPSDNCIECNPGLHFYDGKDDHSCFDPPTDQNYYLNDNENKYYLCYDNCATCSDVGTSTKQNCNTCINSFSFYDSKTEPKNCESDALSKGYWHNNLDDTFYACYSTCQTCSEMGTKSEHKCDSCITDHSFYEGKNDNCEDNTGNNDGYAFDDLLNKYFFCFGTCKTCDKVGNSNKHECLSCKDDLSFYQHKIDLTNCEDNTGSNEGYYYIQPEDTFYKCNPLCKYCFTNATVNPIHDCIECIDTYYFIYGTTYCIKTGIADTNYTISEYYFDTSDDTFKPCFWKCATCSKGGDNTKNNCDSCKNGYSFIETELVEMNCIPKIEHDGFYHDPSNNTYMRCYDSCKTCSIVGDNLIHKCIDCIDGLIKDPTKTTNCVKQCPDLWYIDLSNNYKCASIECPFDFPLLILIIDQCVEECPMNLPYENNGTCVFMCPQKTFPINKICSSNCYPDTSSKASFLYIDYTIDQCIKEINKTIIHFLPLNKPIDGIDFAFEVYLSNSAIQEQSNLSFIDFTECEGQLRQFYSIPAAEAIIFAKFDINRTHTPTYKVEYSAYTIRGEYLDLSHCSNENITVSYPIKQLNDTKKQYGMKMMNKSIDVFNHKNPFYNNHCLSYHEDYNDATLFDRREYIFYNISFCELNCEYVNINYNKTKAQCMCITKPEINTTKNVNNSIMEFPTELPKTNLVIGECYYLLLQWSNVKTNYAFWIMLIFTLISFSMLILYFSKGIQQLYPNIQKLSSKESAYGTFYNKTLLQLYLAESNLGFKSFQTSKQIINNINLKNKIRSDLSQIKEKDLTYFSVKNLMALSFTIAKTSDNRSMWLMLYHIVIEKTSLINSLFIFSDFDIPTLKISHFFLLLNVTMALNAIFFRDGLISFKYTHDSFQFTHILLNSVIISLIAYIVARLTLRLITIHKIIDLLISERKNRKEFESIIMRLIQQLNRKIIVYLGICVTLNISSIYYSTIFCAVYSQTQIEWLISIVMNIGVSFVVHICLCLLTSFMRYYSLIHQKEKLYWASSYIYSIIL